nr:hypothetical protein BaRGS_018501 [Batillaria attramentaria]
MDLDCIQADEVVVGIVVTTSGAQLQLTDCQAYRFIQSVNRVVGVLNNGLQFVHQENEFVFNGTRYTIMMGVREQLMAIAKANDMVYDTVLRATLLTKDIYMRAHRSRMTGPTTRSLARPEVSLPSLYDVIQKAYADERSAVMKLRDVKDMQRKALKLNARMQQVREKFQDGFARNDLRTLVYYINSTAQKLNWELMYSTRTMYVRRTQKLYAMLDSIRVTVGAEQELRWVTSFSATACRDREGSGDDGRTDDDDGDDCLPEGSGDLVLTDGEGEEGEEGSRLQSLHGNITHLRRKVHEAKVLLQSLQATFSLAMDDRQIVVTVFDAEGYNLDSVTSDLTLAEDKWYNVKVTSSRGSDGGSLIFDGAGFLHYSASVLPMRRRMESVHFRFRSRQASAALIHLVNQRQVQYRDSTTYPEIDGKDGGFTIERTRPQNINGMADGVVVGAFVTSAHAFEESEYRPLIGCVQELEIDDEPLSIADAEMARGVFEGSCDGDSKFEAEISVTDQGLTVTTEEDEETLSRPDDVKEDFTMLTINDDGKT